MARHENLHAVENTDTVDTAEQAAPKRKGPAKGSTAAPTTVLLCIRDGKPAVYASSRNGRELVHKFQQAAKEGVELTISELEPQRRNTTEA